MWIKKEKYNLLNRKASLYDRNENIIRTLQRISHSNEVCCENGIMLIGDEGWSLLMKSQELEREKLDDMMKQRDWYKVQYEELLKRQSKEDIENG